MKGKFDNHKHTHIAELSTGFSKLSREEREQRLIEMGFLTVEDALILSKDSALDMYLANHFIENVISCFPIPLGVALNFVIDGHEYVIPMAVEETSIIAGASKTAKWIRDHGELTTQNLGKLGIGQIQLPKIKNFDEFKHKIESNTQELIDSVNKEVAHSLVARGGGLRDIVVRGLPRGDDYLMAVVHIFVDTGDAMGANIINQMCEFLKFPIEKLTRESVGMCILSNLVDTKLTQAKIVIYDINLALGKAIAEGSLFAQIDPYRAATNNKGVLNGIDAVLIATGNDWRAVEAGIHSYAAKSGQYRSITHWQMEGNHLHGVLEAPIVVGIVGGVTRLHPIAKICLNMLNVKNAAEFSRILAAVGLVQNLSALSALVTHGISKGHMKLHISNLAIASGATQEELPFVKQRLAELLETHKRITESDAKRILTVLRKK
jgi:hydroxymethylglutaryl-CoA reductase